MGSRRLILLRHGQAHPESTQHEDFDRTLTPRGVREAEEVGRYLVAAALEPDLVIASPAARTRTTASIVAERCGIDTKLIQFPRALYQASDETIWRQVGACAANVGCVLICGHNPGLSQLASRLGPQPTDRGLPTAGLASALWTHGDWADLEPQSAQRLDLFAPRRS
ncbi:MAG: histidine phosphatase family protein [Steroidobacteraceae bacterium]|jgi:phosphohistidine phosphatase